MNLFDQTAHDFLAMVKDGKATSEKIASTIVTRAKSVNAKTNAFIRLPDASPDSCGTCPVPIGIKDNICIKDALTTCGSRILEGFRPPYDACVVEKVRDSGGIILGGLNMDEFAFGSSTETSAYGPVRNPWDLDRVPGGSSGGSAASVAAGQVVWALGSDTGGSIRQPASFCGVVGLKPTYGRVSRYGLVAFGSSLDQLGPLTKDVTDSAMLLNIIAGFDRRDSTSVKKPVPDYTKALVKDVKGLRIGVPKEYFIEKAGATVKEISLPHTQYAVAVYYIVATAEASSNLARFDGVQYGLRAFPDKARKTALVDMYETTRQKGFGDEAKRRIMLGTYVLSSGYYDAYYLRAQKVRTLIKQDFEKAFAQCDAIVCPTSPTTAFRIGEKINDPLAMYLSDIFTIPANLAGIPAVSVPCGFDAKKLPIGLQIMAKAFDEETLLRVAFSYEQVTPWHTERAKL